jgi:Glycosyltransferase family 87
MTAFEARAAQGQITGSWRRRGRLAALVALADLTLFNVYQIYSHEKNGAGSAWPDFLYFYSFAKAGLANGYQHLYDPVAQAAAVRSIFPAAPFYEVVNPPPFAWLITPLAVLPYQVALVIWTVAMVAALAASAYLLSARADQKLFAGLWLGFLPAYIVAVSAPLAPLVILSLAVTRRLMLDRRDVAAGLVLAIGLLKPNLVILVPFALLVAGYRRLFAAWFAAGLVLAIASVASLGPATADYIRESTAFAANPYALRWSLVPIVGDGYAWVASALFVAGVTLWLAHRVRNRGSGVVLAVGVAGSLLVNHHLTPGDLNLLLVPIWLLMGMPAGAIWKAVIGVLWVGAWLALIFPLAAVVVVVGIDLVALIRTQLDERVEGKTSLLANSATDGVI